MVYTFFKWQVYIINKTYNNMFISDTDKMTMNNNDKSQLISIFSVDWRCAAVPHCGHWEAVKTHHNIKPTDTNMPQGFIIHTDAVNSLLNMIINISIDTNCNILLLISFTNKKTTTMHHKNDSKSKAIKYFKGSFALYSFIYGK